MIFVARCKILIQCAAPQRDAKSALVHAEAVVAAVKPGIQESITYDLLFGIHKLREIQEEREDRKRHILQSQSADFTAGDFMN